MASSREEKHENPYIPWQLINEMGLDVFYDNGKLHDEPTIKDLVEKLKDQPVGRYSKKVMGTCYGTIRGEKTIYAIFRDAKQDSQLVLMNSSFAKIKSVQDLNTGEFYVLKSQKLLGPALDFYETEYQMLKKFNRSVEPLISRVGKDGVEKVYYIMKHEKGTDLWGFLNRRLADKKPECDYPDLFMLKIALLILQAEKAVLDAGYLHCDIKEENMMLDLAAGALCFIDFAFALERKIRRGHYVNSVRKMGQSEGVGTRDFIAPEISKQKITEQEFAMVGYSEKSEIYAIGAVFHTLLLNMIKHQGVFKLLSSQGVLARKPIFHQDKPIKKFLKTMCDEKPDARPGLKAAMTFFTERYRHYGAKYPEQVEKINRLQKMIARDEQRELASSYEYIRDKARRAEGELKPEAIKEKATESPASNTSPGL